MKKLSLLPIIALVASCSKELPIVAEIPILVGCEEKVKATIAEWNSDYAGTKIELEAKFVQFTSRQSGHSPVESYVRIRAGHTQLAPDTYINTIVGDCLYTKVYEMEQDPLAFRSLWSLLAEEIEGKGKSQATVKSEGGKLKVYTTGDEGV